jgi:hypothetical protein
MVGETGRLLEPHRVIKHCDFTIIRREIKDYFAIIGTIPTIPANDNFQLQRAA